MIGKCEIMRYGIRKHGNEIEKRSMRLEYLNPQLRAKCFWQKRLVQTDLGILENSENRAKNEVCRESTRDEKCT